MKEIKKKKLAELHHKLTFEMPYFCENAPMLIKPKSGQPIPLKLNNAQRMLHAMLEKQKKEKGFVRALVLKGRQQGISTYINARFYHTTRRGGVNTFILSHEASTTDKLFKMVKRFHEGVHPALQPATAASNRKELIFKDIDSEYFVGTAGNKNVGRGGTVQLFHGSEAAFWENTDEIESGVMESVAFERGTEIILESTANGMSGMFYEKCMRALDGKGDYILCFIPWFVQEEYKRPVTPDFHLTEEEEELKEIYKLSNEQLCWRRFKIDNAKNGLKQFQQEYPCNVMEAFQTSGLGLIDPEKIVQARKCKVKDVQAPLVFGVDPARTGGDKTVIVFRRGREVPVIMKWDKMNSMRLAGIVARLIDKYLPARVFIDVGYGFGTIDRLREMGYGKFIEGINFGSRADQSELYSNKRAEMWIEMRDWIQAGDVNIPDDDTLHADLSIMPDFITTSNGKMQLVGKDKLRKEYHRSPDVGDALALTFAAPVRRTEGDQKPVRRKTSGLGLKKKKEPGVSKIMMTI